MKSNVAAWAVVSILVLLLALRDLAPPAPWPSRTSLPEACPEREAHRQALVNVLVVITDQTAEEATGLVALCAGSEESAKAIASMLLVSDRLARVHGSDRAATCLAMLKAMKADFDDLEQILGRRIASWGDFQQLLGKLSQELAPGARQKLRVEAENLHRSILQKQAAGFPGLAPTPEELTRRSLLIELLEAATSVR